MYKALLAFFPFPLGVLEVKDFWVISVLPGVRLCWLITLARGSVWDPIFPAQVNQSVVTGNSLKQAFVINLLFKSCGFCVYMRVLVC